MADVNNTIKTTVVVDATQAQQQIIKLGAIASDSTKSLGERIEAKNKQVKLQEQLSKQTISNLEKEIKALEKVEGKEKELEKAVKKLNSERVKATRLSANNEKQLNKLSAAQDKAGKSAKGLSINFKGIGSQLLGAAGIVGAVDLLIDGFKAFVKTSEELLDIQKQLKGSFNLNNRELDETSAKIRAVASTFDEDYSKVTQAAIKVSKELGISVQEATAKIQEGFLKGSNNSGEFLDILNEYPAQFKAVGIDADQAFAIINQQVTEGIYSDKGVDSIKEAGLRLREMPQATSDALKAIGLSGDEIQKQLQEGTITMFEAIQMVSGQLDKFPPQSTAVGQAIADIFGGAGEDAGLRYLQTLDDIELSLDNVAVTASDSQQTTLELNESWNNFVGTLTDEDGAITTLWNAIKGGISDVLNFINEANRAVLGADGKDDRLLAVAEQLEKAQASGVKLNDLQKRAIEAANIIRERNGGLNKEKEKEVELNDKITTQTEQQKKASEARAKQEEKASQARQREAERERERIQKQIDAISAAEEKEAEAEQRAIDKALEQEEKEEEEAARREKERTERDLAAQIERDQLLIEQRILNAEDQLTLELDILNRKKKQELANEDLTGQERLLIQEKYADAEIKMVDAAEKAKADAKKEFTKQAIGAAAEAFGLSQELAVAEMLIAAPQAIGNSFKKAAEFYAPPASIALGALGAAGVVAPIIKGLADIKATRFSKGGGRGGSRTGGSISSPTGTTNRSVQTEAVTDIAANNTARLGVDPSIGSAAGSDAANNVTGGASSGIVFSESKYNEFQNQVDFKEEKTTI